MRLTEYRDLRGGQPCWTLADPDPGSSDPLPSQPLDVAIVGAGIMGAMLAERLTRSGRRVALFDRRPPAHGSTAASTALVLWAADVPLTHLAREIGEDEAARRWRRVFRAAASLARRIDADGQGRSRTERPELYLAGSLLDEDGLREEAAMRDRAGLPSRFISAGEVGRRFGIAPRAALLSEASYCVDPVRLTLGLLDRARGRGATLHFPVDVTALEQSAGGVRLAVEGTPGIEAGTVILASGYERPLWHLPSAFSVLSSYAIATPPGSTPLWREHAIIWEAASSYLYARETADGRVVAGGEDEDLTDGDARDALIGEKAGAIRAKLEALLGGRAVDLDCAWAATFGSSPDGLPAIGPAANAPNVWLASGFGGNGVTFAALGAEIIGCALDGTPDPDAECFDPYRFEAETKPA
ncbi:NAD(P)/FAD-dependent oxidoreductase [Enterovirga rhinocerotis]|uniref:Glycine/D-amino acid oxidase-like deaminating enzyme n=1 Tax=Enterovirga rhinocerotis TaxID=1339210 RepID=A0A4R7BXR3_9HYPH|nr:FAD-dependent oxidoreductase [Enterovirga rhinocerotis]TDR90022.1 glycine/D-amino acid oxidase-like deaminating enzyme [Enterovirga rhinocerotis]